MENRERLRVQKRGKKHSLRKVVDYLKSDTFMYASLLSLPADFPSPDTFASSAKGLFSPNLFAFDLCWILL